jgi:hypothetical protein
MRTARRQWTFLAVIVAAMLLSACGTNPVGSPGAESLGASPAASMSPEAVASATPVARPPVDEIPTDGSCDEDRVCLGVLEPGTYSVPNFDPPFDVDIADDGWVNVRASGGMVLFVDRTAPGDELVLYQGAAPRTFDNKLVAGLGRSPREFMTWLSQRADLDVTEPEAVTLGGLDGWQVDVTVLPDARNGLGDCPTEPCVAIASGLDPAEMPSWTWELGIWAGAAYRLYALDVDGQTVLVVMTAWDATTLDATVDRMQRIVDTIVFGPVAG